MIRFVDGPHGAPDYAFTDASETALGAFLVGDVQTAGDWLLDLLAWTEEVRAGRSREEDWSGNSWVAELRPDGLHLFDTLSDDWEGHYALADASEVMLRYWRFLADRSSAGWTQRELTNWEHERSRAHPLRPVLGPSWSR
ncbi:hypothetical protein [Actinomadura verrucosospora]|uniref:Uncharacterized protein n=1 Tax=Actinomadura verrucosospora TaxID=46165 RepID=A0A7D3VVC9_ACTVE|nr:hypothetical protein [Actinomadura verrucosospora]QKG23570.1 hypothetical protein ACTIVE_5213 [Actinomadura verrucosospora]